MKKMIVATMLALLSTHTQASQFTIEQKTDVMVKHIQTEAPDTLISEETKAVIRTNIIQNTTFANLVRQEDLNKQMDVQVLIELAVEQALSNHYMALKMANFQPTETQLRAKYDAEVLNTQTYHVRHILVDSQAQANQLIAQIQAGASFQALAKKYSKDPGTASKGGDLCWMPLNSWVPEFADSAALLQAKQISQTPVQTQFGYHIIQMVEPPRKLKNIPSFENVRSQVLEMMKEEYKTQILKQAAEHPVLGQ